MSSPPQSSAPLRRPRAHLDGKNPIVLRFQDGQRMGANLQVISVTGGLLSLSKSVDQGSQVKLMFLTEAGSVLGGAEMLPRPDVASVESDAPYCFQCGVQMMRSGSCHACPSCGTTSGCS